MISHFPPQYALSRTFVQAQQVGSPIVALESAVITSGLPQPENFKIARDMEAEIRAAGAMPVTIALMEGKIRVGLTESEMQTLANMEEIRKISLRDFGIALAGGLSGGTTVAATLFVSSMTGIKVFATGGIGGVHRDAPFDVSADLPQLGKSQVLVVCAGVKAILDLPATREVLETQGVPVIGYQTDDFPAFYTRKSGLSVDTRVDSPEAAARIALQSWEAGLKSAILLVVPPPEEYAMPSDAMEKAVHSALVEAEKANIHGAATTPFLLSKISVLTSGDSLRANLALLRNNAHVAGQVAAAMGRETKASPF